MLCILCFFSWCKSENSFQKYRMFFFNLSLSVNQHHCQSLRHIRYRWFLSVQLNLEPFLLILIQCILTLKYSLETLSSCSLLLSYSSLWSPVHCLYDHHKFFLVYLVHFHLFYALNIHLCAAYCPFRHQTDRNIYGPIML